jgi:hypothetical protein
MSGGDHAAAVWKSARWSPGLRSQIQGNPIILGRVFENWEIAGLITGDRPWE